MANDNLFKIKNGLKLKTNTDTVTEAGAIKYDGSGNLILRDGSAEKTILDQDNSVTVTNKSIDGASNTITNIGDSELTTGINAAKLANGSVSNTEFQYLDGVTASIQTQLDNKLDSGAIDATDIANGSVSNTEFQYLDGVTSAIQTQLDGKVDEVSSTDDAVVRFDGTSGSVQDSGVTIDDSNNLNVPSDVDVDGVINLEEQSATPASPSSGDKKLYAKNDGKLYTLDSSGNEIEVGSGAGGGGIFYINEDFETGVANLVAYADAAGAEPVDADGGTPTLSVSAETSNPLIGSQSALITKSASNLQGEGVAIVSETIDEAYENSVHTVEFFWKPDSTVVADALKLFVVHPTTGTVEPLYFVDYVGNYTNSLPNDDAVVHRIVAEIAPIDPTYKVVIHVAGTDSTAYTGLIDNIKVGPQRLINVPIVSEWESCTPTGSWTANTTYSGLKKRSGDSASYKITVDLTGAPTSTSLTITLDETIDVLKLGNPASGDNFPLGNVSIEDATGGNFQGVATFEDANTIRILHLTDSGSLEARTNVTEASPFTFASGDSIQIAINELPISGWDAGTSIGTTQIDTTPHICKAYVNGAQSLTSGTSNQIIDIDATVVDKFDLFNVTLDRIEIKKRGRYKLDGKITFATNATGIRTAALNISGSFYTNYETAVDGYPTVVDISAEEELDEGDFIYLLGWQNSGGSLGLSAGERNTYLNVKEITDTTVFDGVRPKNLVQTKILSANVTSDTTVSDLTFSNLTIGKWYEVTGKVRTVHNDTAANPGVTLVATHDGSTIDTIGATLNNATNTQDTIYAAVSFKFKATATTLTFVSSSATSTSPIVGNGTRTNTYIQIEERNDLRETDKF